MAFSNRPRTLVIPTGADPNHGPVIILDGNTGIITVIGIDGDKMIIDPTNETTNAPVIKFQSGDSQTYSYINNGKSVNGPAGHSTLGLNSGAYKSTLLNDGISRRLRLWLNSQAGMGRYEAVRSTQQREGGYTHISVDQMSTGYANDIVGFSNYLFARADQMGIKTDGVGSGVTAFEFFNELNVKTNGSINPHQTVEKLNEVDNNTTSFFPDPELHYVFPSNGEFIIEGNLFFRTTAAADWKYTLASSGPEVRWGPCGAGGSYQMFFNGQVHNVAQVSTFQQIPIVGRVNNSLGAGQVVEVQWGQQVGDAGPTTLLRGSYLTFRRVDE